MDLPDPGIELGSPALQVDSLPTELSEKLTKDNQTTAKAQKTLDSKEVSHQGISIFLSDYWSFARVLYVS